MLSDRELLTVLAALRFWQRHGPSQPNSFWDRLETDEQDALDAIRTDSGTFTDLDADEIDQLCERLQGSDARTVTTKYVLYDFDMDELATTAVYSGYRAAAEDANMLSNIVVIAFTIETEPIVDARGDQDADR